MESVKPGVALAADVGRRISQRAARHDEEAAFPAADVADLRRAGLLGLLVPEELGGMGAGFEEYAEVAMTLANAAPATALLFNMHASVTGSLSAIDGAMSAALGLPSTAEETRREVLRRAAKGEMFGVAISETAAGSRISRMRTTYRQVEDGYHIAGRKVACSGAGHLDGYLLAARQAESEEPIVSYFLVPPGDGVRAEGEWDPLGMRATASRGLSIDVVVPETALLGEVEGLALPLAYWMPQWLVASYAAVYAGVAEAAVTAATEEFLARSRRGGEVSASMRVRLGRASAEAAAAKALVLWAAKAVDLDPAGDRTRALVYQAKLVAGDVAMTVAAGLAEACGLSSLSAGAPLERLLRDARMGALMPPRSDVAAEVLGAMLTGVDPSHLEAPPW